MKAILPHQAIKTASKGSQKQVRNVVTDHSPRGLTTQSEKGPTAGKRATVTWLGF